MKQSALLLAGVFSIGLLVGWAGRDMLPASETNTTLLVDRNKKFTEQDNRTDQFNLQDPKSSTGKLSADKAGAQKQLQSSTAVIQASKESAQQSLRKLLQNNEFQRAIQVLQTIEREQPTEFSAAKNAVYQKLNALKAAQEQQAFLSLIDAYLAVYFKDIRGYLELANFKAGQDSVFEAIAIFQQADDFASSNAHKQQVKKSVVEFVTALSEQYERELRQYELAKVYEQLLLTNLDYPEFRFYLADLYLREGLDESARRLLSSLATLPQWRSKAQALLLDADNPGQSKRETIDLPLVRKGSHYLAPLVIGYDTQAQLMIDTGASMTTISRERFVRWQDRLSADYVREQTFRTANGLTVGSIYRFPSVEFAGFELRDFEVAVLDYPSNEGVDGLLGMNVLQRFRFELDQAASVLKLSLP